MWAIVEAAGWPIWTILAASVVSLAIILERLFSLRRGVVVPEGLLAQTLQEYRRVDLRDELMRRLQQHSPLGRLFAAGLRNVSGSREVMKESIEDEGRQVAYQLERLLTTLGTIAAMSPLLGLLGTVIGMIEIFGSQNGSGANPQQLAHGISVALYNTAFGLIVAIPSMMFYRFFRSRVDGLLVEMEAQAIKLVEVVHGERRNGN
ncbi:MotA/TolQ/ExbB proton channel family protein [Chromobacterium sphagni]|uniref:Flagellar motor protein MotA n=1 Tax=Chromobacterium sphagni TaxID=1903179 RepID=A0A1S1X161_9NEIS|nr:MotA/TolQ/ExbB proton channel family protein [Chromobacterium sphagni]OHX13273.1 flagellar motor protein MotA [Chromobacterium sphagni]OHX16983.1 flagellar motor protein MotA [Chromobacterium sphagni]